MRDDREADLKCAARFPPYTDWDEARGTSLASREGVRGDELGEALLVRLVVLVLGDGVRGMRPPAVLLEKRPRWLFIGVETEAVAIVIRKAIQKKTKEKQNK